MSDKDIKVIAGIVAGFVFIIGFGIGIELYSSNSQGDRQDKLDRQSVIQNA